MARNIEIKARMHDFSGTKALAESLSDGPAVLLKQQDTFYRVPKGRLKLRVVQPRCAELIYYQRSDRAEPRLSEYLTSKVEDPISMNQLLSAVLGISGQVRKERWLCLVGQTRIHLDRVEGLGDFLELEYVLREGEQEAEGLKVVRDLASTLGIRNEDVVAGAYADLLR